MICLEELIQERRLGRSNGIAVFRISSERQLGVILKYLRVFQGYKKHEFFAADVFHINGKVADAITYWFLIDFPITCWLKLQLLNRASLKIWSIMLYEDLGRLNCVCLDKKSLLWHKKLSLSSVLLQKQNYTLLHVISTLFWILMMRNIDLLGWKWPTSHVPCVSWDFWRRIQDKHWR